VAGERRAELIRLQGGGQRAGGHHAVGLDDVTVGGAAVVHVEVLVVVQVLQVPGEGEDAADVGDDRDDAGGHVAVLHDLVGGLAGQDVVEEADALVHLAVGQYLDGADHGSQRLLVGPGGEVGHGHGPRRRAHGVV